LRDLAYASISAQVAGERGLCDYFFCSRFLWRDVGGKVLRASMQIVVQQHRPIRRSRQRKPPQ